MLERIKTTLQTIMARTAASLRPSGQSGMNQMGTMSENDDKARPRAMTKSTMEFRINLGLLGFWTVFLVSWMAFINLIQADAIIEMLLLITAMNSAEIISSCIGE
jgi:hypothetical protein